MDFDEILRIFWSRPVYQRLFLAFTVGLFLSCAARAAGSQTVRRDAGARPVAAAHATPSAPSVSARPAY